MEKILVLDFGGQYNQLIARRVRECGVYCEIKRYDTPLDELRVLHPAGIIFTGGPNSVYEETSPHIGKEIFSLGIPVLGICYGCQHYDPALLNAGSRSSASATAASFSPTWAAARSKAPGKEANTAK